MAKKQRKETPLEIKARLNREAVEKHRDEWFRLLGNGVSLSEIGRSYGVDRRVVSDALRRPGPPNTSLSTRTEQHNLRIDPDLYKRATERAKELGLVIESGPRAKHGEGSVAAMIELIGAGQLVVDFADIGDERDEQTA